MLYIESFPGSQGNWVQRKFKSVTYFAWGTRVSLSGYGITETFGNLICMRFESTWKLFNANIWSRLIKTPSART